MNTDRTTLDALIELLDTESRQEAIMALAAILDRQSERHEQDRDAA